MITIVKVKNGWLISKQKSGIMSSLHDKYVIEETTDLPTTEEDVQKDYLKLGEAVYDLLDDGK